jgi:hypothetical protein
VPSNHKQLTCFARAAKVASAASIMGPEISLVSGDTGFSSEIKYLTYQTLVLTVQRFIPCPRSAISNKQTCGAVGVTASRRHGELGVWNSGIKTCLSVVFVGNCLDTIKMVGILKVFLFTALDQMTIHGAVAMDFLFIQPFGWIRIIIAWGRKSQNNPSDLNIVSTREVCGDHN